MNRKGMFFLFVFAVLFSDLRAVEIKNMCVPKTTVTIAYGPYVFELDYGESRPLDSFYLTPPDDPEDADQVAQNLICIKLKNDTYAFTRVNTPWMEQNDNDVPLEIRQGRVPDCNIEYDHPFLLWNYSIEGSKTLCPDLSFYPKCLDKSNR